MKKKSSASSSRAEKRLARREAAVQLGISVRTLNEWEHQPWFPASGKTAAGYLVSVIRAASPRMQSSLPADGATEDVTPEQYRRLQAQRIREQIRRDKADADKRERENQVAAGELYPRQEIDTLLCELCTVFRDRAADMPKALARLVPQAYRARLVEEGRKSVEKILREIKARMEAAE